MTSPLFLAALLAASSIPGVPMREVSYPEGIAVSADGSSIYVASGGAAAIEELSSDLTLIRRHVLPDERSWPLDVEVACGGFVVADKHLKCVWWSDGRSGFAQLLGGDLSEPVAITRSIDGASCFVLDAGLNCILEVGCDGVVKRTLGSGGRGDSEMNCPHDLAASADGTLLVADSGNRRIQAYCASDGRAVGPVGRYGDGPTQFLDPTGVMPLRGGDALLVVDHYAHRLQVLPAYLGDEDLARRIDVTRWLRYPIRTAQAGDWLFVSSPQFGLVVRLNWASIQNQ